MNLEVVLTAPGTPNLSTALMALHADSAARLVDMILEELEGEQLIRLVLIDAAPEGPLHPLSALSLSKLSELRDVFGPDGSVAIVRKANPVVGVAGFGGGGLGGFAGRTAVGAPVSFQTLELSRALGVPVHLRS